MITLDGEALRAAEMDLLKVRDGSMAAAEWVEIYGVAAMRTIKKEMGTTDALAALGATFTVAWTCLSEEQTGEHVIDVSEHPVEFVQGRIKRAHALLREGLTSGEGPLMTAEVKRLVEQAGYWREAAAELGRRLHLYELVEEAEELGAEDETQGVKS